MSFFKLDGKVLVAQRQATGKPGPFRYLSNTDGLTLGLEVTKTPVREYESGQRLLAANPVDEKSANLDFIMRQFTPKNVAMAFWAAAATIAAGSVSGEVIAGTETALPAVGDILRLEKGDVSNLVVTDSTGSPKTLTANTNYRLYNDKLGSIEILDITTGAPFVAPLTAAYDNGEQANIPMFGIVPGDWWVRFEAVNISKAGDPVLVEFYKVGIDPISQLQAKGQDQGGMPLSGTVFSDDTKAADPTLGQFGRIVWAG